jgi:hypothetical protein
MRVKGIVEIDVPKEIARPAYVVVDRRVRDFVADYQRRQALSADLGLPPMTLADLCRNVYLQGLMDGVVVGPRVRELETKLASLENGKE